MCPDQEGFNVIFTSLQKTDPEDIILNRFPFFNVCFASQPWEFCSPEMSESYSLMPWINLISAGRDSSVFWPMDMKLVHCRHADE